MEKTLFQATFTQDVECINCGHIDKGVYCSNCGCRLNKHRISIGQLLSTVIDYFSNFEEKYFRTIVPLFKSPIAFINQYLNGATEKYYIPFKFFLLNLGIHFFIYSYFKINLINENVIDLEANQLLQQKSDIVFDALINDYGSLFSMLIIPLYVLASKILFRKSEYNIAERATAITFLLGQLMVVQSMLHLVSAVFHPFFIVQKYLVISVELYIFFILSFGFFKSSIIEAIWKTIAITFFVFQSMHYILMLTQEILHLYYGE
jgi:Protein of unknown function (DUF3667)